MLLYVFKKTKASTVVCQRFTKNSGDTRRLMCFFREHFVYVVFVTFCPHFCSQRPLQIALRVRDSIEGHISLLSSCAFGSRFMHGHRTNQKAIVYYIVLYFDLTGMRIERSTREKSHLSHLNFSPSSQEQYQQS